MPYTRLKLSALLLPLILCMGCDRAKQLKKDLAGSEKASALPIVNLDQPWFEGRIIVTQNLSSSLGWLSTETVEYWISQRYLRRERRPGGLHKLSKELSGIIVDLDQKTVCLYRSSLSKKYYCKLSFEAYQATVTEEGENGIRPTNPGYETVFLLVPKAPAYSSKTTPNSRKVVDLNCDVVDLYFSENNYSERKCKLQVAYCPQIKIDRRLIEQSEPNLPEEVKAFPLEYSFTLLTSENRKDTSAFKTLSKMLEKATKIIEEIKQGLESIEKKKIPDSEFSLSDSYQQVASIEELNARFAASREGGGHRSGDD